MALQQEGDPVLSQNQTSALTQNAQTSQPTKVPQFIGTLDASAGSVTATPEPEPQAPVTRLAKQYGDGGALAALDYADFDPSYGMDAHMKKYGATGMAPKPANVASGSAAPVQAKPATPAQSPIPMQPQAAFGMNKPAFGNMPAFGMTADEILKKKLASAYGANPQIAAQLAAAQGGGAAPVFQPTGQAYSAPSIPVTSLGNIR